MVTNPLGAIQSKIDWFLKKTKDAQVVVILICAIAFLWHERSSNQENYRLASLSAQTQKIKSDSIYSSDLRSIRVEFQQKIDDCMHRRMEDREEAAKMWQQLFMETDDLYKRQQQLNSNR